jgi:hypothetical protein
LQQESSSSGSNSSSSHHQPLLPLQPGQSTSSSSTSSSSELRAPDQHGPELGETDAAPVLTDEDEADDDDRTVDYGSAEDEEHNHWITYIDHCRFAPTVYPWWQTDTLFFGINCIVENNSSSQQPSPRPQVYFNGLELELHHSLAKWLHNQVYLTADEILVYRVDGKTIVTGIERDLDE